MPRLPTVAIIGRPNTGKSTLFNRIVGERRAIESPIAGTTRDQVATEVRGETVDYLLVDTGGIGGGTTDTVLEENVTQQSLLALERADLILFTINAKEELTAADRTIVDLLRKKRRTHVPVVLIATKCDREGMEHERAADLHALGIGDAILGVSATHNSGLTQLEADIERRLTALHFGKEAGHTGTEETAPRIAIVGRPNAGKSSLINALMPDPERESSARIVSDIPGTTRDTTDTLVRHEGEDYVFVDTAGLRRRSRVEGDIEYYSTLRSMQAIVGSDITVLVLDATQDLTQQDKRIARMAVDEGRGLILLLNKCDLVSNTERDDRVYALRRDLPFCDFAPILAVSAITRENLPKIFGLFAHLRRNLTRRIATKDLQRWYEDAVQRLPARTLSSGKFVTQADEVPPTFVLFLNSPQRVQRAHVKYLEHSLRSLFAFDGVPIRFVLKKK